MRRTDGRRRLGYPRTGWRLVHCRWRLGTGPAPRGGCRVRGPGPGASLRCRWRDPSRWLARTEGTVRVRRNPQDPGFAGSYGSPWSRRTCRSRCRCTARRRPRRRCRAPVDEHLAVTTAHALLLVAAGLAAGLVNRVAGGGCLLSFPALLVVGYPALTANVTSTVGIWPGYLGGVIGFRRELKGQGERVHALAGTAIAGALIGAGILPLTPDRDFADRRPKVEPSTAARSMWGRSLLRRTAPTLVRASESSSLPSWGSPST